LTEGRGDGRRERVSSDLVALVLWILVAIVLTTSVSGPVRALSGNELLLFRDAAGSGYTYCDSSSAPYGQPILYLTQAANSLGAYGWNDVASAYKQSGGWTLYEHNNYSGQSLPTYYTGVCNLGSWSDRISSVAP
jgi:hypothetical protein